MHDKDTVTLKTILIGKNITGTLVFNLYEKDINKGTIQGYMKDSLLIADYSFISEGISSVRQVVFKKTADGFKEGLGDIIDINGKIRFKNAASLNFDNSIILHEVDCEK